MAEIRDLLDPEIEQRLTDLAGLIQPDPDPPPDDRPEHD